MKDGVFILGLFIFNFKEAQDKASYESLLSMYYKLKINLKGICLRIL